MTEPSGGGGERQGRPVVVPAIALVALTALGIIALLGGLDEAPDAPKPLGQGAVLDQGMYMTKFVESRVKVEKAEFSFDDDKRFVELVFDVTNKTDETARVGMPPEQPERAFALTSFAGSLVRISPAFSKESGPFTFALLKGDESQQLQPDVPTQVVVRYRLKAGERPPDKVTIDVASFEEGTSFLNAAPQWEMVSEQVGEKFLPEIKARVTLPVRQEAGA
ncbi:hypothetical protein Nocox_03540 [Nonomuraea coxensis DSM 45129]|uniref:DUF4352 domain-containing protein n=1 Tax=Nonomuraea coxensis DSM 45129 TaxID=1122611 RepID=A0ABX8TUB1_9ACTN|nr:hypothetical protein [Nonomuraea coxensis]QYC38337.1 hypothetical protein Nocox_03540 [Nonomuraea coxensis DSM 45129]